MITRATKRRLKYINAFGGKCQRCGYNRCLRALQFHHKDAETRKDWPQENGRTSGKVSTAELEAHPEHFELLCANCHFERHDAIDKARQIIKNCLYCGNPFLTETNKLLEGKGKYCSKKCQYAHMTGVDRENIPDRFAKYVRKEESGCWIWTGAFAGTSGVLNMRRPNGQFVPTTASRVAFFLKHGRYPKSKLRRSCPTTGCVNPDHLLEKKRASGGKRPGQPPANGQLSLF